MAHRQPQALSIGTALAGLTFLPDRTPTTSDEQSAGAFGRLSTFGDGAIYVGHWAGNSEWERHSAGDEIVMVIDGRTRIFFLIDGAEVAADLGPSELIVVPQGTWHRFETPDQVKLLSATPQPTDHSAERPT